MSYLQAIKEEWNRIYCENLRSSTAFPRTLNAQITPEHYKSLMQEIYHYTKNSPQIIWLAAASFKEDQQATMKKFIRHGLSEVGHHDLALDDLEKFGIQREEVRSTSALPATEALDAYARHQSATYGIKGYLGYMFYLEYIPTQSGSKYMEAFEKIGVSKDAMSFIAEHVIADEGHNKAMEDYIEALIKTPEDFRLFVNTMQTSAFLYASMIEGAYARADRKMDALLAAEVSPRSRESYAQSISM